MLSHFRDFNLQTDKRADNLTNSQIHGKILLGWVTQNFWQGRNPRKFSFDKVFAKKIILLKK